MRSDIPAMGVRQIINIKLRYAGVIPLPLFSSAPYPSTPPIYLPFLLLYPFLLPVRLHRSTVQACGRKRYATARLIPIIQFIYFRRVVAYMEKHNKQTEKHRDVNLYTPFHGIGVNSYWAVGPEPPPHILDHGARLSLSPHFLRNCFRTVHYHAGKKKFFRSYKPLNL